MFFVSPFGIRVATLPQSLGLVKEPAGPALRKDAEPTNPLATMLEIKPKQADRATKQEQKTQSPAEVLKPAWKAM